MTVKLASPAWPARMGAAAGYCGETTVEADAELEFSKWLAGLSS
jgi:hypothetical protein